MFDRAPADVPGQPLPGGSGGGVEGAEAPALVAGGGAPRSPPGLSGLCRPSGVAGRLLELLAPASQGPDLLAEDEGGRAGCRVGGELRAEVLRTAWATARPVVAARGAGRRNHVTAEAGPRPELEVAACAAQRVCCARVVRAIAQLVPAEGRSVATPGLGTGVVDRAGRSDRQVLTSATAVKAV